MASRLKKPFGSVFPHGARLPKSRIWSKQDGTSGASFEVTASTVRFLSSRGEGGDSGPMSAGGGMEMAELPPEDDIPF
jgi:single-strand DNA-binding protein